MATGYYLLDHPNPACPDRGDGRYWGYEEMQSRPRLITLHTSESFLDLIAPDTGAENVANYFATTTMAASYHTLVDSDSTVRCLPAGLDGTTVHTAFHCYQRNTANLGLSLAMRAVEWATAPSWWKAQVLHRAAIEAALWSARHDIPIRLITKAEADAGRSGYSGHGILQPEDRTDPGALFPWDDFLERVRRTAAASGGDNEGDDDVPSLLCNMSGSIFGCFAGIWRPLSGPEYEKWNGKVDAVAHTADEWKTLREWGRVA